MTVTEDNTQARRGHDERVEVVTRSTVGDLHLFMWKRRTVDQLEALGDKELLLRWRAARTRSCARSSSSTSRIVSVAIAATTFTGQRPNRWKAAWRVVSSAAPMTVQESPASLAAATAARSSSSAAATPDGRR